MTESEDSIEIEVNCDFCDKPIKLRVHKDIAMVFALCLECMKVRYPTIPYPYPDDTASRAGEESK